MNAPIRICVDCRSHRAIEDGSRCVDCLTNYLRETRPLTLVQSPWVVRARRHELPAKSIA